MPINMLCDICNIKTESNYVAAPLDFTIGRVELIIGINIDGKPQGIICRDCISETMSQWLAGEKGATDGNPKTHDDSG